MTETGSVIAVQNTEAASFLDLTDQIPGILWTTDAHLMLRTCKGAGLIQLCLKPDQVVGMSLQAFFQTNDPDSLPIRLNRQVLAGEVVRYETEWRGRILESHVQPLRDANGQITGTIGMGLDVTERTRDGTTQFGWGRDYRNLFELANDAILVFEPESEVVLDVNECACEMYGIPIEQFIGMSIKDLSQDVKRGEQHLRRLLAHGRYDGFETVQYRADRTPLELVINSSIIEFRGRTAVLSINRDIGERKRGERALRESEARFRILFEQSPDAVLLIDVEEPWRIVECNAVACTMNGYSREQLIGMPVAELDPTAGDPEVCRRHIARLRKGGNLKAEAVHRRQDGTLFPIEYTTALITIGGRELILGIDRDVTERVRAYEELAESERRFALLLSNAPALVYRCLNDANRTMQFVSDYALKLTGYSPRDLVGGAIEYGDLILEEDRARVLARVQAALVRDEPFRLAYRIKRRDGAVRHVEEHGQAVRVDSAEVLALEGVIYDVTERTRAAERTATFSSLGRRLNSSATAVTATRIIADVADSLLGWDAFTLLLRSPGDELLHPILDIDLVNGRRTESAPGGQAVPPGPVSLRAMTEGPQLLLPGEPSVELEGLLPFGDKTRPSASLMFVPVRGATGVIGILSVQSYTPNAYTMADIETLQALADHCGGALERVRAEEALRESEERFRAIFERTGVGIALAGLDTRVVDTNPALQRMLHYSEDEFKGRSIADFAHIDDGDFPLEWHEQLLAGQIDRYELERRFIRKDGEPFWGHLTVSMIPDAAGNARYLIGLVEDITQRKAFEDQLAHRAFHDPLTGLPNRALFTARLGDALRQLERQPSGTAVLFVDLDRFKYVNDSLGHEAGDRVLAELAGRLHECLRPEDTPARLSGDEFAVLLAGVGSIREAELVANRIGERLSAPLYYDGHEIVVTSSIGIALGAPGDEPATLLGQADVAMYRAKNAGRGHHRQYDPTMGSHALERLALESDLRRALERGEFEMYYQPQVELATGHVVGLEGLLRWKHPSRGLVGPADFISLAEETGMLSTIGRWAVEEVCLKAKRWRERYSTDYPFVVSLNLAAKHFQEAGLVTMISRVLQETGLEPTWLGLEITESALVEDSVDTDATLRELRLLGVQLIIDDFGTGYSSLAYLKRFPVDVLKIDRSFVDGLGDDPEDTAIVHAVISLAAAFGIKVLAEGVEKAEHAAILQELGCRLGQGNFYAKPVPADTVEKLLAECTSLPKP